MLIYFKFSRIKKHCRETNITILRIECLDFELLLFFSEELSFMVVLLYQNEGSLFFFLYVPFFVYNIYKNSQLPRKFNVLLRCACLHYKLKIVITLLLHFF